ncbi:glutathione S-transferase [Aestuariibacter halophilus]|uniref:Glutathione S-transferase n=1 Tax=Fluctibacter halophilus TaxID=226011 RepID=A0ABS8GBZ3_9ALTE|nr:glutathione S-transferase family protein [Aestuariibacter halophilus]MCC2618089.1 glutathione S-transferase [Aestuariibacter halophilus]
MPKYVLYGTPFSFYTAKARAYFQVKGIPFEEVFATAKVYKSVIKPRTGVQMIPVVATPDGEYLQDTAAIIDALEQRHPEPAILPSTPRQRMLCLLLEAWADEWLLLPAMHYRWNHDNTPYIYEQFGQVAGPWLPAFIRRRLGKKLAARFAGFVPKLGIHGHVPRALEHWFENTILPALQQHFSDHDFVLGERPSLADVSLMGPFYAHLYSDPAPGKLLREKAPALCDWIERMRNVQPDEQLQWLPDDAIPNTLAPLVADVFEHLWPMLANTVVAVEEWALTYADERALPRGIGEHQFRFGTTQANRVVLPFQQWKMQRILDAWAQLSEAQQRDVQDWLQPYVGEQGLAFAIHRPVTRRDNRIWLQ